jgi:hypothetical protein
MAMLDPRAIQRMLLSPELDKIIIIVLAMNLEPDMESFAWLFLAKTGESPCSIIMFDHATLLRPAW